MGKRRQHRDRRERRAPDDGSRDRLPAPKTRLKALFRLMTAVTAAGDRALSEMPGDEGEAVRFDRVVLMRGVNAVKSARLLLEEAHWETAAGPVRQLFELVVNMEYLASQPDRDQATLTYAKFGLMQAVLAERAELRYRMATGRTVDEARVAKLDTMLAGPMFGQFRRVNKKGEVVWARSWSGKHIRALVEASARPLRKAQYEQLFVVWSEQVHGAPTTLLANLFPVWQDDVAELLASDDRQIVQTANMAVMLFAELWLLLPGVPAPETGVIAGWMAELMKQAKAVGAAPVDGR